MRHLLSALVVVAATLLLYRPSLDNPLVWDDVIHLGPAADASASAGPEAGGYRRPVVLYSYRVQAALGLDSPCALHAANIAIHAANAVLVYALATLLGAAWPICLSGSLLFAVHPLQSGAVAYVSGRTDLLAALFTLLALCAALYGRASVWLRGAAVLVCVVAGALSKEVGVVAAVLVCAALALPSVRARGRGRADAWLAAAALAVGAASLSTVLPPAVADGAAVGAAARFAGAGAAAATFAGLLVWPSGLHLDRLVAVGGALHLCLGVVVAVGCLGVVADFVRRPRPLGFAALAAVLAYAPVAGFVPIYPAIAERWVFAGEQLVYLPLAALAPLAAGALYALVCSLAGARAAQAATLAAAAALAVASAAPLASRQRDFADEEGLYRSTLARSPSARACFNLGVSLIAREAYGEAVEVYRRCTRISPSDPSVFVQLGHCYAKAGDRREAEISYARALELDARNALAWSNYAALEANAGFYEEARAKWLRALAIDPDLEPARRGLAQLERVIESRGGRAADGG